MKRLLLYLLVAMLSCVSAYAAELAPETAQPMHMMETNEFLSYIEKNGDSITDRMQAKKEYSDALRDLTAYSETELMNMGYSNGTIDLVEKLREDMDYEPTEAELTAAAPTMTFYCYDFVASTAGNRTDATFKWTFEWDSRPNMRREDCVGAIWNVNGMVSQYESFQITFSDGTTYEDNDGLYGMEIVNESENRMLYYKFPMDSDNSLAWCKSGRGEFRLHLNERVTAIQIAWGYGHQEVEEVTAITLSIGSFGVQFGNGYETLCGAVRTYYVN